MCLPVSMPKADDGRCDSAASADSKDHQPGAAVTATHEFAATSADLKLRLAPYRAAAVDFEVGDVRSTLAALFSPDAVIRLCHPFGTVEGHDAFFETALMPLHAAMPDLERRDMIVMAGRTNEGHDWIGTMGNYMGTFLVPFQNIPPTGHLAHMRYHEYFRFENGKVIEVQAIWDLPELMMQAGAWPMAPQLGAFLCTPAPMAGDGLTVRGSGQAALDCVLGMVADLVQHPADPDPQVMRLADYWHPKFNWYGPAGIGTARGIAGFRHWHQIPFLRGMPDRGTDGSSALKSHWISEGDYVCETGWPNMRMTLSGDGWMGIAPPGKTVELRSLDFWRVEAGRIRENWVLIDLLDLYDQIGVDVLARLQEFNKVRISGAIRLPDGLTR